MEEGRVEKFCEGRRGKWTGREGKGREEKERFLQSRSRVLLYGRHTESFVWLRSFSLPQWISLISFKTSQINFYFEN